MQHDVRVVGQDCETVHHKAGFFQHHDLAGHHLCHFLAFEIIWVDGHAVEHSIKLGEKLLLGATVVGTGFLSLA